MMSNEHVHFNFRQCTCHLYTKRNLFAGTNAITKTKLYDFVLYCPLFHSHFNFFYQHTTACTLHTHSINSSHIENSKHPNRNQNHLTFSTYIRIKYIYVYHRPFMFLLRHIQIFLSGFCTYFTCCCHHKKRYINIILFSFCL